MVYIKAGRRITIIGHFQEGFLIVRTAPSNVSGQTLMKSEDYGMKSGINEKGG